MASFGYLNGTDWIHHCSASLVTNTHLLTAAHCLKDAKGNKHTQFREAY
jgi:V8-like Glu-specific endopeptidase